MPFSVFLSAAGEFLMLMSMVYLVPYYLYCIVGYKIIFYPRAVRPRPLGRGYKAPRNA